MFEFVHLNIPSFSINDIWVQEGIWALSRIVQKRERVGDHDVYDAVSHQILHHWDYLFRERSEVWT